MPYALFSDDVQVSRAFSTKTDVWRHAEQSGLVVEVGTSDGDPPRKILDMACTIRACDNERPTMIDRVKDRVGSLRVTPDVSQPIEAAAS